TDSQSIECKGRRSRSPCKSSLDVVHCVPVGRTFEDRSGVCRRGVDERQLRLLMQDANRTEGLDFANFCELMHGYEVLASLSASVLLLRRRSKEGHRRISNTGLLLCAAATVLLKDSDGPREAAPGCVRDLFPRGRLR